MKKEINVVGAVVTNDGKNTLSADAARVCLCRACGSSPVAKLNLERHLALHW